MYVNSVVAVKTPRIRSVYYGREVQTFELVPKVRQRQCLILETEERSKQTVRNGNARPSYVDSVLVERQTDGQGEKIVDSGV